MATRITGLHAPKHCIGRKRGCRKRKKKHRKFLEGSHARLKEALDNKMRVVKTSWKNHYATVQFVSGPPQKFYCNFNYLNYLLRSRLFYRPSPFIIVNLYYFSRLEQDCGGDFMVYHPFFREKIEGKTQKEVGKLNSHLQSDLCYQDARRFYK